MASAEPNTGAVISFWRANSSAGGQSADSTMTRLVAARASGAFWLIVAASSTGHGERLAGRHQPVDQAGPVQLRGRDAVSGQCDLHGQVVGDPAGQPEQAAGGRDQAAGDFRQPETGLLAGHDQVAGLSATSNPPASA